jgi:dihydroxyacetone kinase-like protein
MERFENAQAGKIVLAIAAKIIENRAYLSEIDGKIGDGDHGVNMAKGFSMAAERIGEVDCSLDAACTILADVLLGEIGGSMGPLYGLMFSEIGGTIAGKDWIAPSEFSAMLRAGLAGIESVGQAKVGDKTLLDTLVPAILAFDGEIASGGSFNAALDALSSAAEAGRDSTIDMVAKIGRASRLGERSRGALDAGATSCAIILVTLAAEAKTRLS